MIWWEGHTRHTFLKLLSFGIQVRRLVASGEAGEKTLVAHAHVLFTLVWLYTLPLSSAYA
jgi:hypothetical protein